MLFPQTWECVCLKMTSDIAEVPLDTEGVFKKSNYDKHIFLATIGPNDSN